MISRKKKEDELVADHLAPHAEKQNDGCAPKFSMKQFKEKLMNNDLPGFLAPTKAFKEQVEFHFLDISLPLTDV